MITISVVSIRRKRPNRIRLTSFQCVFSSSFPSQGVLRPLLRSSPLNESGSVTCRIDVRAAVPLSCTLIQYTIGLLKYEKDGDGFRPNKMKFQVKAMIDNDKG